MTAQKGFGIPTPDEETSSGGTVGGTVEIDNSSGDPITVEVTNTPLPVTNPVGSSTEAKQDDIITSLDTQQKDALTDAELRATPVSVTGDFGEGSAAEYLFSDNQATLADGAEIDTGWLDMGTVDKYQFEGLASAPGVNMQIQSSSGPGGTGSSVTTNTPIGTTFHLFSVPARQRYMRFRWQNNTGGALTGCSVSIKATYGSSDKLGVFPLDTDPTDFSQAALVRSVSSGLAPDGDYINVRIGGLDSDNSSQTNLGAGETWTGEYQDVRGFSSALVFVIADQELSSVTLQWSPDGVNPRPGVVGTQSLTGTEVSGFYVYVTVVTTMVDKYVCLSATNGPVATTLFESDLWFYTSAFTGNFGGLEGNLSALSTALLTRSLQVAKQPDGDYANILASGSDGGNSSLIPLGPGGEFVGTWFNATGYVGGMLIVESDVASATDGVVIEFTEDDPLVLTPHIHRSLAFTYNEPGSGTVRFYPTMQGEYYRIRYVNGPIPQANIVIRTELLAFPSQAPMASLGSDIDEGALSATVRAAILARNDNNEFTNITQSDRGGLRTTVTEHEVETPIKAKTDWGVRGTNVPSTTPVKLTMPPTDGVGTVSIQNEGGGDVWVAPSSGDVGTVTRRRRVYAGLAVDLDLTEASEFWALSEDTGGAISPATLSGASATGGTDPSNALSSNDVRARLSAGQTLSVSGFTPQGIPTYEVTEVVLGVEARNSTTSPATETVTLVSQYGTTGGNVGSLTSPTISGNAGSFYLVSVTTRNAAAFVTSVTGLGLTWEIVDAITDDSGSNRISVWRGSGTPTGNGTIQAIFAATATNCTMKVTEWAGVDLSAPIENFETLGVPGSTSSYSDSIDGTDKGVAITFVTSARRTHTPGSGFTELTKVNTGSGPNDSRQSVSYLPLISTGTQVYTGSFTSAADWVLVAVSLKPNPIQQPRITIGYSVSGTPGAITGEFNLTASDAVYEVDVTPDRAWTTSDISNMTLTVSKGTGAATAAVDHVYVKETEGEVGSTNLVTVTVVGDA